MTPTANTTPKTEGQFTLEQFQRNQQVGMLANAHMQFVTCISMQPPPSKMPIEVRAQMFATLERTLNLFRPQGEEEEAAYALPRG